MPLYSCDVQKVQGTEYWTNRYVVSAASVGDASVVVGPIITAEQAIHTTNVRLDRYRVRPLTPGGDEFIIVPIGFDGAYEGGALAGQLPLFNVARVDFAVSIGRPSRKYYRVGLTETMVEGPNLNETYRALVDTTVEAMISDMAGALVDVDGQAINSSTVIPAVAMRQLRRGSRRRLQPII